MGQTTVADRGCAPPDSFLGAELDARLHALAGRQVLGAHAEHALNVDLKRQLHLGRTRLGRWNAREDELAEELVLPRPRLVPLVNPHAETRLAIAARGREQRLGVWGGRIARKDDVHLAVRAFDADRHRNDIEQLEPNRGILLKCLRVERRADRHRLIRIDALGRRLAKKLGEPFLNMRQSYHKQFYQFLLYSSRHEYALRYNQAPPY